MMEKYGVIGCPNCRNIESIITIDITPMGNTVECKQCGLRFRAPNDDHGVAPRIGDSEQRDS